MQEESGLSSQDRELIQASVRQMLGAPSQGAEAQSEAALTGLLGASGLLDLGASRQQGGIQELVVVMEEAGRAAKSLHVLGAYLWNMANVGPPANAQSRSLSKMIGAGSARICVAVETFRDARDTTAMRGTLSGSLLLCDGIVDATHVLFCVDGGTSMALVDLRKSGVTVAVDSCMGGVPVGSVELSGAEADVVIDLGEELRAALRWHCHLALASRGYGSAKRSFELVVDYAKQRKQFGQAIGSFQAVQHKLANCFIALEGVRLTLKNAGVELAEERTDRFYFAATACANASQCLRPVALEVQHCFGAIGYAREHEASTHFKRVHLDCFYLGGGASHRKDVADILQGSLNWSVPEFDLGPAGNAFRTEVRQWLDVNLPLAKREELSRLKFHEQEYDESFAHAFGKTGWNAASWPTEFGGQARSSAEMLALNEELDRARAPRVGANIQAFALMQCGTREQQDRYLPEIRSGAAMIGMGYSEPNAGSDLSAITTRAVKTDDGWLINGQKIWTTTWWGRYMFLAARTSRHSDPKDGISMFMVPMDTPGIKVQPAFTLYDGTFANVFYDDVRVPDNALIGPVDKGWEVMLKALSSERGLVGGGIVSKIVDAFNSLARYISSADALPHALDRAVTRDVLGKLASEIEVGRQLMMHCAETARGTRDEIVNAAVSKVYSSELMERFGEHALELLGPRATISAPSQNAVLGGRLEHQLRHSLMWVISIGTNEIQRNLIARHGLDLPR